MTDSSASEHSESPGEGSYLETNGYENSGPRGYYSRHVREEEEDEDEDEDEEEESEGYGTRGSSEGNNCSQETDAYHRPKSDTILDKYSSEVRLHILENELRVLKTERSTWSEREQDLLDRLQASRDNLREQRKKLLDAEKASQAFEQEVDLINIRSKVRQESLEKSYLSLCENVKLTEEASLRAKIEIRRLQTKNLVLEELLRSKGLAHNQLEAKLRELMEAMTGLPGKNPKGDTSNDLQLPHAFGSAEMAQDSSCGDEALASAYDSGTKNSGVSMTTARESNTSQSESLGRSPSSDGDKVIYEYEAEEMEAVSCGSSSDAGEPEIMMNGGHESLNQESPSRMGVAGIQKLANLMEQHLKQIISCSKETERQMREAVDAQIEELKELLLQTRSDLAYKTEECNRLTRSLENMRGELAIAANKLDLGGQVELQLKSKYENLVLEVDSMKRELDLMETQYEELKRELESSVLRERQNKAVYDEYVKNTDAKLFKLELLLSEKDKVEVEISSQEASKSGKENIENNEEVESDDASFVKITREEYDRLLRNSEEVKETNEATKEAENAVERPQDQAQEPVNNPEEVASTPSPINLPKKVFEETSDGYVKVTQEYMLKLLKKEAVLLEKLKTEVLRAYTLQKRLEEIEAKKPVPCVCRMSLKKVKATRTKRCWCKYKRVLALRQKIASASLKRDAKAIASVIQESPMSKKQKAEDKE